MVLRFLLFFLLFFIYNNSLTAQVYNSKAYYTQDGLPSDNISGITQDNEGLMWFLTTKGIVKYDGTQWHTLHTENEPNLIWPASIASSDEGSIFTCGFSTEGFKLSRIKNSNVENLEIPDNFTVDPGYYTLQVNSSGTKLVLSSRRQLAVYLVNDKKWNIKPSFEEFKYIHQTKYVGDSLWIATEEGLYTFHENRLSQFKLPGIPNNRIYRILHDGDGKLYLLGESWLGRWYNNEFNLICQLNDSTINPRSNLLQDRRNNLIFNSNQNFYRYNPAEGLSTFELSEADAVPWNSCMFVDSESNLWVGSYRGAFKINSFQFTNFNSHSGLLEDEGTIIFETNKNNLFIGGSRSFVIRNMTDVIRKQSLHSTRYDTRLLDYAKEPGSNTIYIAGSKAGLGIFTNNNLRFVPLEPVASAVCFADNQLLVAAERFVYSYDPKTNDFTELFNANAYIRQIYQLSNGKIALVTAKGLFITDFIHTQLYTHKAKAAANLYSILELEDQVLLGSTIGLMTLQDNTLKKLIYRGFSEEEPIYDLMKAKNGTVWIGTNNGVYAVADSATKHFNMRVGLSGNEINRNSLFEDNTGQIWIGTNKGVSKFSNLYPELDLKPKVRLLSIKTKLDERGVHKDVSLTYTNNDLEFFYQAISFRNEDGIRYRYRLNGYDTAWRQVDNPFQRSVRYTNLTPGESYRFEFQSQVQSHSWTDSVYSGVITIQQPFYKNWWFILLASLLLFLFSYIINNSAHHARYSKKLEKTVEQKTREIEKSRKKLKTQNAALKDEISERKIVEEERLQLIDQLKKTNSELDRFVYSASHDLSAPLKSMSGLLNIVEKEEEEDKEYITLMKKSVHQLEVFIQELIDFSRNARQDVIKEKIDLKDLIDSVIESHKFMNNSTRIDITKDISAGTVHIVSDKFRLKTILNNLMSNAINFTDFDKEHSKIRVKSWEDKSTVKIEVSDNGHGIDEHHLAKIFDMFYRANEGSQGSGLGLYIVKESVDKLNGEITVSSQIHEGTTFIISIPKVLKDD